MDTTTRLPVLPLTPILVPATIRVSLPAIVPPSSCAAGGDGGPASR
jgi:hypothetical protein